MSAPSTPVMRAIDQSLPAPDSIDAGPAPMLQWIKITDLVLDPTYQREWSKHNVDAAKRIAGRFNWSKFSTVHVAPIEGGKFAIVDGQHRTHAAAACGFESVPCQVTHMTVAEQAGAFAAINGLVTKVTPLQIFKAALAAEESWAVEVRDVCAAAGCRAMPYNKSGSDKRAGEIYSIAHLRKAIERRSAERITAALSIIRKMDGIGNVVGFYALDVFHPLLEAFASRPHILARPSEAVSSLTAPQIWKLVEEARAFVLERRRAGQPTVARVELLESLIGDAIEKAMPAKISAVPVLAAVPGAAA